MSKLLIHPKWYECCLRFSGLLPSPETLITKNTVPSPFSRNSDIPGATSCSPEDDVTSYLYDFSILACWQQHQTVSNEQLSCGHVYPHQNLVTGNAMCQSNQTQEKCPSHFFTTVPTILMLLRSRSLMLALVPTESLQCP